MLYFFWKYQVVGVLPQKYTFSSIRNRGDNMKYDLNSFIKDCMSLLKRTLIILVVITFIFLFNDKSE